MGDNIRKSCMGMEVDPYFSNKKWPSALFFFFFLISINMSSEKNVHLSFQSDMTI